MLGLPTFSVFGLRFFQNSLILIGFVLAPISFLVEANNIRLVCGISMIIVFIGFFILENKISLKYSLNEIGLKEDFKLIIKKHLISLEYILQDLGISEKSTVYNNMKKFEFRMNSNASVEDLEVLLHDIEIFLEDMIQLQQTQYANMEKESSISTPQNPIAEPLAVLGLSNDTHDMVVIKKAYKKLIKSYHPDVNSSSEAGKKIIAINLAFEEVKKHINAS